jgi:hypothetical protein
VIVISYPATQQVCIQPVRQRDGGDRDARVFACSNDIRLELGAVTAAASNRAGWRYIRDGVQVSTSNYVDTILPISPPAFKMRLPDAYTVTPAGAH